MIVTNYKMRNVSLNEVRLDGGTQNRKILDQNHMYGMVEHLKEGGELPLMKVGFDGSTYWLIDGFHRYHAYKLLGSKEVLLDYTECSLAEAVVLSWAVNAHHGLPRTIEDKQNMVMQAFEHPLTKDKTTYEIAKICVVSQSFVAGIRDPEKRQKQKEAKEKHIQKKAQEITSLTSSPVENTSLTSNTKVSDGMEPDAEEMKATELAIQADMNAMYMLLESDEPLAAAYEEIKSLNYRNAQLELRLHGLMTERNEAVKMVKQLQKELDKMKAKK